MKDDGFNTRARTPVHLNLARRSALAKGAAALASLIAFRAGEAVPAQSDAFVEIFMQRLLEDHSPPKPSRALFGEVAALMSRPAFKGFLSTRLTKPDLPRDFAIVRNAALVRFLALPVEDHEIWLQGTMERYQASGTVYCDNRTVTQLGEFFDMLMFVSPERRRQMLAIATKVVDALPQPVTLRPDPPWQSVERALARLTERLDQATQRRWSDVAERGDFITSAESCWSVATYIGGILSSPMSDRRLLMYNTLLDDATDVGWLTRTFLTEEETRRSDNVEDPRTYPIAALKLVVEASIIVEGTFDVATGDFEDARVARRNITDHPFGRDRPLVVERVFDERSLQIAEQRDYRRHADRLQIGDKRFQFEVLWRLK